MKKIDHLLLGKGIIVGALSVSILSSAFQVSAASTISMSQQTLYKVTDNTYVNTGGLAVGSASGTDKQNKVYLAQTSDDKQKIQTFHLSCKQHLTGAASNDFVKKGYSTLGHANDLTYGKVPGEGKYYLFSVALNGGSYDPSINKEVKRSVSCIDPSTGKIVKTCSTNIADIENNKQVGIDAIAYLAQMSANRSGEYYVIRKKEKINGVSKKWKEQQTYYICELVSSNGNLIFQKQAEFTLDLKYGDNWVMQGICEYKNRIYVAINENHTANGNGNKNDKNYIYKTDMTMATIKDNNVKKTKMTKVKDWTSNELEGIDIVTENNGKEEQPIIYCSLNNQTNSDDYIVKFPLN